MNNVNIALCIFSALSSGIAFALYLILRGIIRRADEIRTETEKTRLNYYHTKRVIEYILGNH